MTQNSATQDGNSETNQESVEVIAIATRVTVHDAVQGIAMSDAQLDGEQGFH